MKVTLLLVSMCAHVDAEIDVDVDMYIDVDVDSAFYADTNVEAEFTLNGHKTLSHRRPSNSSTESVIDVNMGIDIDFDCRSLASSSSVEQQHLQFRNEWMLDKRIV